MQPLQLLPRGPTTSRTLEAACVLPDAELAHITRRLALVTNVFKFITAPVQREFPEGKGKQRRVKEAARALGGKQYARFKPSPCLLGGQSLQLAQCPAHLWERWRQANVSAENCGTRSRREGRQQKGGNETSETSAATEVAADCLHMQPHLVRQAASVVRGQHNGYLVVHIEPLWVVAHGPICHLSHAIHEAPGLLEVFESKGLGDGITS